MKINNILVILILIGATLIAFKLGGDLSDKKLRAAKLTLRKEILKNDSLQLINEGLYTKLVADTLTITQLRKKSDSLELELKDPKIVIKTVYKFVEVEKPIDGIVVKDSTLEINDAYPDKESPFVKYFAKIDLKTNEGIGKFTFEPLNINIGIEQKEDGTDFLTVESIEVQALPMELPAVDNFGFLVGAGLGTDFMDNSNFMTLSAGIRIKKIYLDVQGATNQTINAGFKLPTQIKNKVESKKLTLTCLDDAAINAAVANLYWFTTPQKLQTLVLATNAVLSTDYTVGSNNWFRLEAEVKSYFDFLDGAACI